MPVPGGPYSNTPLGIFAPTFWNRSASERKSLISTSSSTASSEPATSSNVVWGMSFVIALAFDLPKFIRRPPPPCIWLKMKTINKISSANGRREMNKVTSRFSLGTTTL